MRFRGPDPNGRGPGLRGMERLTMRDFILSHCYRRSDLSCDRGAFIGAYYEKAFQLGVMPEGEGKMAKAIAELITGPAGGKVLQGIVPNSDPRAGDF